MRFSTDDGRFGFIVSPLAGHQMFRFQIVIDGQVIGNTEECILGSAMARLANLRSLDDERLTGLSVEPALLLSMLRADEVLHDDVVLSLAESVDRWLICGYIHKGNAAMLAQEYDNDGTLVGRVLVSMVPIIEYDAVVSMARSYWSMLNGAQSLG